MSSRYMRQSLKSMSLIDLSINLWKVAGALQRPKGIRLKS